LCSAAHSSSLGIACRQLPNDQELATKEPRIECDRRLRPNCYTRSVGVIRVNYNGRAGGAALLTTGETPTVTVSRQAGPNSSGGAGSLIIDPIVSEWAVVRGGNSVARLDGVRPHRALQSPIDDGRRVVPRPARVLTGRFG